MVRSILFLSVCLTASTPDRVPISHVRSESGVLRRAIEEGTARSAHLRALVDTMDASDLFVYVTEAPQQHGVNAHLGWLGASGGRRYVKVAIDPRLRGIERLAVLGHELQHAVEIAGEPTIDGPDAIERLYQRIGFAVRPDERAYESAAAIATARKILRELAGS